MIRACTMSAVVTTLACTGPTLAAGVLDYPECNWRVLRSGGVSAGTKPLPTGGAAEQDSIDITPVTGSAQANSLLANDSAVAVCNGAPADVCPIVCDADSTASATAIATAKGSWNSGRIILEARSDFAIVPHIDGSGCGAAASQLVEATGSGDATVTVHLPFDVTTAGTFELSLCVQLGVIGSGDLDTWSASGNARVGVYERTSCDDYSGDGSLIGDVYDSDSDPGILADGDCECLDLAVGEYMIVVNLEYSDAMCTIVDTCDLDGVLTGVTSGYVRMRGMLKAATCDPENSCAWCASGHPWLIQD
jgi:hypothetical protein